jgi:hypothetical protein
MSVKTEATTVPEYQLPAEARHPTALQEAFLQDKLDRIESGEFVCDFCGDTFPSKQDLTRHLSVFSSDSLHVYHAHSRPSTPSVFRGLRIRPAEKKLFMRLMNEHYNWPLRYNIFCNKTVKDELNFGIDYDNHLILTIIGVQGSGKSTLLLKVTTMVMRRWLESHGINVGFMLTFNFGETSKTYKLLKKGWILAQDEAPGLVGPDSKITLEGLEALLNTMRLNNNSWIFANPDIIKEVTSTLMLEVVGFYPKTQRTLCVAYSRLRRVLGWAVFDCSDVLNNDYLQSWYLQRKRANAAKVKEAEGLVGVSRSYKEVMEDVKIVMDTVKEAGVDPKNITKNDVDFYIMISGIPKSAYYKKNLKTAVLGYLEDLKSGEFEQPAKKVIEEKEVEGKKSLKKRVIWTEDDVAKYAEIWRSRKFEFDRESAIKKLAKQDRRLVRQLDIYRMYTIEGKTQAAIGREVGLSFGRISQIMTRIGTMVGRMEGKEYELWCRDNWQRRADVKYVDWFGGGVKEPDLVVHFKHGEVAVISCKVRNTFKPVIELEKHQIENEQKYAVALMKTHKNVMLFLDFYEGNSKAHIVEPYNIDTDYILVTPKKQKIRLGNFAK